MINCPVLHVNGDCPEDVSRAIEIAFKYRNYFRKDIVIDLVVYRRWGHSELDELLLPNSRKCFVVLSSSQFLPIRIHRRVGNPPTSSHHRILHPFVVYNLILLHRNKHNSHRFVKARWRDMTGAIQNGDAMQSIYCQN
ncbi:hypothetical protein OG21DRAFT_1104052 [Imleria badia]|nr:hypothetical protein OG21DRAFT_1104052 [Imleria badia]